MGEEGAGGEGAQGACPEQLEDDLSGCCFSLTLVQGEKHEGLGCATVGQPCPGKRGQSCPTCAPLCTSNPSPLSYHRPSPASSKPQRAPLGKKEQGMGSWGVWEEVGAESPGSVQAGRANMVLGISNEVLPGFRFPGRGFSYSPLPSTPPPALSGCESDHPEN